MSRQQGGSISVSQGGGLITTSQPGGSVSVSQKPQRQLWTPAQLGDDLALWLDWKDSPFDLRTDGGTDYVARWGDLRHGLRGAVGRPERERQRRDAVGGEPAARA